MAEVMPSTPAAEGAFLKGDVVLRVEGYPVTSPVALEFEVAIFDPGQKLKVRIERGLKSLDLWLSARPFCFQLSNNWYPPKTRPDDLSYKTVDGKSITMKDGKPFTGKEQCVFTWAGGRDPFMNKREWSPTGTARGTTKEQDVWFLWNGDILRQYMGHSPTAGSRGPLAHGWIENDYRDGRLVHAVSIAFYKGKECRLYELINDGATKQVMLRRENGSKILDTSYEAATLTPLRRVSFDQNDQPIATLTYQNGNPWNGTYLPGGWGGPVEKTTYVSGKVVK